MIRSNLKSGAQGVVDTFTLSSGQGQTITIPNSAGAQAVVVQLKNENSGAYILTGSVTSGTVLASINVSSTNINNGCFIVEPDASNDVTLSVNYNGSASTCYYVITP